VTAHQYWDRVWRTERGRAEWSTPDPWVARTVESIPVQDVLDLGCGVGRHALFLAERGLAVRAVDRSAAAIAFVDEQARRRGLSVTLHVADLAALPCPTASVDYVLAFNVIYHGDENTVRRTLAEVRRVLRPGGIYQSTMLSKHNTQYGRGVEVSPNTFVQPAAADDKAHPHLYVDAADLARLHDGFQPVDQTETEHAAPGSVHWHCLFTVEEP
jgi:SAM-dependent methyltransferase